MSTDDKKHRSHLPMPNTSRSEFIAYDAKDPDSKFPPIEEFAPTERRSQRVGHSHRRRGLRLQPARSVVHARCRTAEKLALTGLKYNRFHTTALCSPTRQALLTGRNHHSAGMGGITEIATGAPGYCSVLPNSMSPLAKTLKLQRLFHRAVRQVPRSTGVADESGRAVQRLAHRRRWL